MEHVLDNGYVEVSRKKKKEILFIFDDIISKTHITIGTATNEIDLPNGTVIDKMNETSIIYGYSKYLIFTAHAHDFGVTGVHDVFKNHCGRQYLHAVHQYISTKSNKVLMYLTMW